MKNSSTVYTITHLLQTGFLCWDDAQVVGRIGMELESRTRLDMARIFLRRAIELEPTSNAEWYVSLAFACFRDVAGLSTDGELAFTEGIDAMDSDFIRAAYIAFYEDNVPEELIQQLQDADKPTQFALVQSLLWRGRGEDAIFVAREAIRDVQPGDILPGLDMYCGSMNWMAAQGLPISLETEVLPYIQAAIQTVPERYTFRALLIQLYQTQRNWPMVYDTGLAILRDFPDEETTMLAVGVACELQERPDEAILWYNRAIGAKPSYIRARLRLAKLYASLGATDLAEQILREIEHAFPGYAVGAVEAALALYSLGKKDAIDMFHKAFVKLKPYEKGPLEQRKDVQAMLAQEQARPLSATDFRV